MEPEIGGPFQRPSTRASAPANGRARACERSGGAGRGRYREPTDETYRDVVSAETTGPATDPVTPAAHHYGGQAVLEGVMMRGHDRWAIAVRRPGGDLWLESHPVPGPEHRQRWLRWPLLRGCYALVDSLSVGSRAIRIAAHRAVDDGDEARPGAAVAVSMVVALVLFVGIFILLPSAGTKGVDALIGGGLGDGVAFHTIESVVRIAIFLTYLWAISLLPEIRRVFQHHGAEHQTIAAWEHGEVLDVRTVAGYSTLHVRCGTNFLVLVMLLAVVVYSVGGALIPPPADAGFGVAVAYHVVLRIVLLPVVGGLAYEGLRLGAAAGDHPLVRALMAPGLWLQRITTREPTTDQIEVAVRAFEAVVPVEDRADRFPLDLPSPITFATAGLPIHLAGADPTEGR
jgi:uncharacterized protein YqhQ